MSEQDGRERRKHQRVILESLGDGLQVEILGHGVTQLFDMSYEGAAFTQTSGRPINEVGLELDIRFQTQVDQASLKAEVVRVTPQTVAARFLDVGATARIIIDRLVTDRIVGLNMTFIDPKHYEAGVDFTHWYHGPKETNLYLWWRSGQLMKAQMDMSNASLGFDGEDLFFENKQVQGVASGRLNNNQIALKAMAILQQMASTEPALLTFRKLIGDHVQG